MLNAWRHTDNYTLWPHLGRIYLSIYVEIIEQVTTWYYYCSLRILEERVNISDIPFVPEEGYESMITEKKYLKKRAKIDTFWQRRNS